MAIPPCTASSQSALACWLLDWFAGASAGDREAMVQATYGLWLARNDARDGKQIASPHETMNSVATHINDWHEVHGRQPSEPRQKEMQRWMPPEEGWTKVNSDGAVSKQGEGVLGVELCYTITIERSWLPLAITSPTSLIRFLLRF